MTPDNDRNFNTINTNRHVEGLTSVTERVVKKKEQQQKREQQRKGRKNIKDQLLEEPQNELTTEESEEDHIDYRA